MIDPLVDRRLEWGERGALLREQSEKYGVSLSTLKRYYERFRQSRFEGLLPAPHRSDRGRPRQIPIEVVTLACRLRDEVPQRTTTTLITLMESLHPELNGRIKRSTLDRHLRWHGKARSQCGSLNPKPRRQYAKQVRGALWHTDLCILPLQASDESGSLKPVVVAAMLDDATRFLVHMEAYLSQDEGVVEDCFKKAARKHGLPLGILFDNGTQFVCEQFLGALEGLGVRPLRAAVGSPESKGKQERLFQTLQSSLLPELQAMEGGLTLVDVNRYVAAWVEHYHQRRHRELPPETPTPAQRWNSDPTQLRPADPVRLEGAFLLRAKRKVSRTQLVEVGGRRYLASRIPTGTIVDVRHHPRRPESIQLWLGDEFIQMAPLYVTPESVPEKPAVSGLIHPSSHGPNFAELLLQQYQASGESGPDRTQPAFTEPAYLRLLERSLGRTLEPLERRLALQTWHRFGRLRTVATEAAVEQLIRQRGTGLHISYYLEAVAREHSRLREVEQDV